MHRTGIIIEIHSFGINQVNIRIIIVKQFSFCNDYLKYPLNSSEMNIYLIKELSFELKSWDLSNITSKCVVLPKGKNVFVSFPFLLRFWRPLWLSIVIEILETSLIYRKDFQVNQNANLFHRVEETKNPYQIIMNPSKIAK